MDGDNFNAKNVASNTPRITPAGSENHRSVGSKKTPAA